MRPNAAATVAACLVLFALTGCAPAAATATPVPTVPASPTPTPEASAPLSCDELVPPELVAATLEGADAIAVEPVAAVSESSAFDSVLLEGAGGLACSWRVGSGMPEYNAPSDWAYLSLQVLPGAAAQWVPLQMGDGPSPHTRHVDGIEASVSGGDPGWALSAPVADSWVEATISAAALTSTGSRFSGLGGGAMIDRLVDVAATAFPALQQADPSQLAWPTVELRQTDAMCNGGLDEQGIVAAMQLPPESTAEVVVWEPDAAAPRRFDEAVHAAARAFTCAVEVDGRSELRISTARGFAPLFDHLTEPDASLAFTGLALVDAPADARAVSNGKEAKAATAYLSIGGSLYRIDGDGAEAVAQAIVAQTY